MRVRQIGVAAGGKRAQQVERRRRLPISLQLSARIRRAGLRREVGAVDDVAAISRQLDAAAFLGRRRAGLGELAGNAADLDHRRGRRIGQHHRHLQEQPEEIADIVGAVLGKAFGAVAALQQKRVAGRHLRQCALEVARFAGKNERRKACKLRLDVGEGLGVGVIRHLHDRLRAPRVWSPLVRTPLCRVCPRGHDRLHTPAVLYTPALRCDSAENAVYSAASRA